jgi:glutaredoxin
VSPAPRTPVLLLLAALAGAVAAQTVYKSVGADGRVVYSDRPPAGGRLEKTLTFENLPSSALPASASSYVEQLKRMHARDAAQAAAAPAQAGVVLYTASWCGYCRKARAWLGAKGIAYRDVDVETPDGIAAFASVGGGSGVPVIVADGRRLAGFSAPAYDALFASRK